MIAQSCPDVHTHLQLILLWSAEGSRLQTAASSSSFSVKKFLFAKSELHEHVRRVNTKNELEPNIIIGCKM